MWWSTKVRASFLAVSPALTPCSPTTLIAINCIRGGSTYCNFLNLITLQFMKTGIAGVIVNNFDTV